MTERPALNPHALRAELSQRATALGFNACGVVRLPTQPLPANFAEWLARRWYGDMQWLARDPARRADPSRVLPEARSALLFALNYFQPEPARQGRIAKYALGRDYHRRILRMLKQLCSWLRDDFDAVNRPYVDTGPILEKPLAALAGIGWQGKNTVILNPSHGQFLFLGVILTSLDFPPDAPAKDRCGSCSRCISACPTNAIPAPYQLDARKCIAYLTIELKGPIPLALRRQVGDHLFGCDDCLDVCPWNRWAQRTREAAFAARHYPNPRTMLSWDEATFNATFEGTPIRRLGLHRWLRNCAVVLGNCGTTADLPALRQLTQHPHPLPAEHARWAIAEITARSAIPPHPAPPPPSPLPPP